MTIIKHLNGIRLSVTCESIEQLKELRERANVVFGPRIDDWSDADDLYFSFSISSKYIMGENATEQIDFIKHVIQLKDGKMYVEAGDIFGSEFTRAVQIATMLEAKCSQIEISGDDHLDYDTIRGTYLDI